MHQVKQMVYGEALYLLLFVHKVVLLNSVNCKFSFFCVFCSCVLTLNLFIPYHLPAYPSPVSLPLNLVQIPFIFHPTHQLVYLPG